MQENSDRKKIFQSKLKAALLHSIITLCVVVSLALIVFELWYPSNLSEMLRGGELFKLVLLGEVVLGPLLSFVVFSPLKARRELVLDYTFIAVVQFSALGYGVFSVASSRPAYLVFVKDRVEVVSGLEYELKDLEAAGMSRLSLPFTGPKLVCAQRPNSGDEYQELMHSIMSGRDIQYLPKYHRVCEEREILSAARSGDGYYEIFKAALPESKFTASFVWLPLHPRYGVWVIVFPNNNQGAYFFINLDPYEL